MMQRRVVLTAAGTTFLVAVARCPSERAPWAATAAGGSGQVADPPAPLREVAVTTGQALAKALQEARPGDHIVLADGSYDGAFTLVASGKQDAPIVLRAQNQHGATLTDSLSLEGERGWVHGLVLSGDGRNPRDAPLRLGGDHATVTRSLFTGRRGVVLTSQQYYRIGYNKFTGAPQPGLGSGPKARFDHIFIDIDSGVEARLPEHGQIYRNLFLDSDASDSESHVIYVGPSGGHPRTPSLTDLVIEYNYIDTRRRRSIYTKRAGIIRHNHIVMTRGAFGIRHGVGGKMHGNRVVGCRDAIVNGPDHDIRGNDIQAAARLQLMAECLNAGGGRYNAADRALLVGNRGDLIVGDTRNGGEMRRPVRGVRVYGQLGDVELGAEEDTIVAAAEASLWCPEPVTLAPSEVGPDAARAA
ncbi:MAG TPA: chondroitinase-B domain-containing protein [Geminicoccaceae bacterium]|nr:chondroitinase-B domain-containing protein [Geminicoccaceae bacterium]